MQKVASTIPSTFNPDFNELTETVQQLGFDAVLYSFFPKPMFINSDVQPVIFFSEKFAPFVNHYLNNDYGNRDFILRLALQGQKKPIDWWEEINKGNVTPEEIEVTRDAKDNFNIHHGLSIPVLYGTFAVAGISVISMNEDITNFQALKTSSLDELKTCADNYHRKIIKSKEELRFFISPLLANLTDTKKKVLKHLLSGQPMKTIPHTFGISKRYAEKTLISLRQEFGNISTNELIYILGMVNMHEYL